MHRPSGLDVDRSGSAFPLDGERQRLLDVLSLHRLARRADGTEAILQWLTRRTGCWAGLLDGAGRVLVETTPGLHPGEASLVARSLDAMLGRGLQTFAGSDGPDRRAVLLAIDDATGAARLVFAIVGPEGFPASLPADAAAVLATCWSAEETRRVRGQVEIAEVRCREAVLHLLMSRHLATARQLASTLSPVLPDPIRVHVIECAPDRRSEVVRRCAELTDGKAWSVRCPVYAAHVIVLAPASPDVPEEDHPSLEADIVAGMGGCVVGTGEAVPLADAAVGYEQAFHALAVARGREERSARFDAALDLPTLVGRPGLVWANAFLAPLISYIPARTTDPDAHELTATARSWLAFSTAANRHLKIHRNTLTTRLRSLEELLQLDLSRVGKQAALDLALRIRAAPGWADATDAAHPDEKIDLDDLLRSPGAQQWAQTRLRPVRDSPHAAVHESTLRVWLENDARLSATAVALDLSVPGTRKRVTRLEQVLQRSLLHPPSARYDLWMAVRAADLGAAEREIDG